MCLTDRCPPEKPYLDTQARLTQLSQLGIKIGISDSARRVSFHHSTNRVVDGGTPLAAAVSANPS